MQAAKTLSRLYEASRLYVNFFQPSFKLKSKTRNGARVLKHYYAPETPYHRLLASDMIPKLVKDQLRAQNERLDPIKLLETIRKGQTDLVALGPASAADKALSTAFETLDNHFKTGHTLSLQNRPTKLTQNKSTYTS
jgi:hypothetical protein